MAWGPTLPANDIGCDYTQRVAYCQNEDCSIIMEFHKSDKNVLGAVKELRDRRKKEICYQQMLHQVISLLESADIDKAIELLEACEDNDD